MNQGEPEKAVTSHFFRTGCRTLWVISFHTMGEGAGHENDIQEAADKNNKGDAYRSMLSSNFPLMESSP